MRSVSDDPQPHEPYRTSNRNITFRNCGRKLLYSVMEGFSVHDSPKRPTTGGLQSALQPNARKLGAVSEGDMPQEAIGKILPAHRISESESASCRPKPHPWLSGIRPAQLGNNHFAITLTSLLLDSSFSSSPKKDFKPFPPLTSTSCLLTSHHATTHHLVS